MSRNVDIIAVGLILLGFALFMQARNVFRFEVASHRVGAFYRPYGPVIVVPEPPSAPPPVPFTRD
jgi:uncharacterized membrane protein